MHLSLLLVRLASVVLVRGQFVPDEYWQSVEVAHAMVFGYGYKTWEWRSGIRSYFFPSVIAAVYKTLQLFGLDNRLVLIELPRVLVALLVWLGDEAVVACVSRLHGRAVGSLTCWLLIVDWSRFYCAPRTLTNTVEMALVSLAVASYLNGPARRFSRVDWRDLWYLVLGAVCVLVRVTGVLIWLPLWLHHFTCLSAPVGGGANTRRLRATMLLRSTVIAVCTVLSGVLLDSSLYGRVSVSAWQFLRVNLLSSSPLSLHYGASSWHAHFTASCPLLLGPLLIPAAAAVANSYRYRSCRRLDWQLSSIVLFVLLVYSCSGHKEFRFLLPILPLVYMLLGRTLHQLGIKRPRSYRCLWACTLAYHVPLALYLSLVHQRGGIDITHEIATRLNYDIRSLNSQHVLYLMPCHSAPLYSHLHVNVSTRFLTCEPNLHGESNYHDEADIFYEHPAMWLQTHCPSLLQDDLTRSSGDVTDVCPMRPTLVVMYEILWRSLASQLSVRYGRCAHAFDAHFVTHQRRSSHIILLCLDKNV